MKINKVLLVIIVFCLFGCNSSQLESTPIFTAIPIATLQPTGTSKPSSTLTQTIQSIDSESQIKVISKDKQTYIAGFDWNVSSLIWSENGKTLIIGPQNRKLYIYDVENKKITINHIGDSWDPPLVLNPSQKTLAITLCNDPNYVISTFCSTQDYSLNFINLETGKFIKVFHIADKNDALSLDGQLIFSPDGKLLIANCIIRRMAHSESGTSRTVNPAHAAQ